ncbi:MAG TPA: histidine kinase [Allosphingosinicella sp.]|nr:histidine kinase [Allosphingosinicella sp.]
MPTTREQLLSPILQGAWLHSTAHLAESAAPVRLKRGAAVLIAVFWAVHLGMLTLRTAMRGSDDQIEIGLSRLAMSLFGAVLCYVIYRCLRPLRRRKFGLQTAFGAALAFAAACAHAVVGTLTFEVLSPVPLLSDLAHFLYSSIWWFWFYFSWTTAYLALSYSVTVQEQERHAAELAVMAQEAQVRALRYQINPHFLFNTLNAISALVRDAPSRAEEMLVQLSDFFRRSLAVNPMEDLTLSEEVELQRLYLEIERTRFPDRLRFEVALDPGTAEARVPALLLQPLVENAVKHGVARSEGPTSIRIRAAADGPVLEIVVENDAKASGRGTAGEKVGLRNVHERLRSRFADEASLVAAELPEDGFRNTLRIPLRR